jgi:hypothetical protein
VGNVQKRHEEKMASGADPSLTARVGRGWKLMLPTPGLELLALRTFLMLKLPTGHVGRNRLSSSPHFPGEPSKSIPFPGDFLPLNN